MNSCNTDFIFPPHIIPSLAQLRSEDWLSLVDGISNKTNDSIETIAFTYMMVKLNNCQTCNSDSFRAMNGCLVCSSQSISRYRGSDRDLIAIFQSSVDEIRAYQRKREK